MPTVDFTLEDLKKVFLTRDEALASLASKSDVATLIKSDVDELRLEMNDGFNRIISMVGDDLKAWSGDIERVDKLLALHISSPDRHGGN